MDPISRRTGFMKWGEETWTKTHRGECQVRTGWRLEGCGSQPRSTRIAGSHQKPEERPGVISPIEVLQGINSVDTLPLDSEPPELRGNKFLLF